jgi:threonylcarbamoyladenosine tRNA methylthiotransferase MtaB
MGKVAVFTIGCKVNQSESEELKMALARAGHVICRDPASADLCVVNTCTVTAESDRKCRKLIRWLNRQGARGIVAAGCYAHTSPDELKVLPGVRRVLSRAEKKQWYREVEAMLHQAMPEPAGMENDRFRGFVKVQDGCERGCSYCIVPLARGKEVSRTPRKVLQIVTAWLEAGAKEIVLCGVNLGRYSSGPHGDLAGLLREVTSIGGDFRVRISSIELEDLKISWLREWAASKRVCPHLHLPLQSGDVGVLRDMGRGYRPSDYLEAVENLRSIWPEATLTTEVMVGYPGESDTAFENTIDLLREVKPSRVHVFRFSPRPGTPAWSRKDVLNSRELRRRSSIMLDMAKLWRSEYEREQRGSRRVFLVERLFERNGIMLATGTTEDYIKACMIDPGRDVEPGCMVEARVAEVTNDGVLIKPIIDRRNGSVKYDQSIGSG